MAIIAANSSLKHYLVLSNVFKSFYYFRPQHYKYFIVYIYIYNRFNIGVNSPKETP